MRSTDFDRPRFGVRTDPPSRAASEKRSQSPGRALEGSVWFAEHNALAAPTDEFLGVLGRRGAGGVRSRSPSVHDGRNDAVVALEDQAVEVGRRYRAQRR